MALCVSSLAFGLAGCETASSLFSSMSDAPTAAVASAPATAPTTRPAQVAIAPVIGPPDNVSKQLQAQLAGDLEKQNIRVAKSTGESAQYTLRGYVVSSIDKKGSRAKISYIWDVTDAARQRRASRERRGDRLHPATARIHGPRSPDPWSRRSRSKTVDVAHGVAAEPGGSTCSCERRAEHTRTDRRAHNAAAPRQRLAPLRRRLRARRAASERGAIKARVPIVNGAPGDGSRLAAHGAAA